MDEERFQQIEKRLNEQAEATWAMNETLNKFIAIMGNQEAARNVAPVRGHLSIPLLPCFSLCLYVFPMVSIHIRPHLYHSDLLAIIDAPHRYLNIR
jgi:hypothetical protein